MRQKLAIGILVCLGMTTTGGASRLVPDGERGCANIPAHALEAAEAGHANAQAIVGQFIVTGQCDDRDASLWMGMNWLISAADQGHIGAAASLGRLFETGKTVPRSYPKALHYYRQSAEGGSVMAQHRLGMLLMVGAGGGAPDTAMGLYWLGAAASQGDGVSAAAIGLFHARGLHGIAPDTCVALDWFEASELLDARVPVQTFKAQLGPSVSDC